MFNKDDDMGNQRLSIVPGKAVKDKELGDSALRTLCALGLYGDPNGWCFPSQATLAKMLGKSRQAVSKDIQTLKDKGYLNVIPRFEEGKGQTTNLIQIKFDYPPATSEVAPPATPEIEGGATPEVAHNAPVNIPTNAPVKEGAATIVTPLTVYRELAHLQVAVALKEEVTNTVTDLPLWYQVVYDWIATGYNPRNIKGMLECYTKGGVPKKNGKSKGNANEVLEKWAKEQGI